MWVRDPKVAPSPPPVLDAPFPLFARFVHRRSMLASRTPFARSSRGRVRTTSRRMRCGRVPQPPLLLFDGFFVKMSSNIFFPKRELLIFPEFSRNKRNKQWGHEESNILKNNNIFWKKRNFDKRAFPNGI